MAGFGINRIVATLRRLTGTHFRFCLKPKLNSSGHTIRTVARGTMQRREKPKLISCPLEAGCVWTHMALQGRAIAASTSGATNMCRCAHGKWSHVATMGYTIATSARGAINLCRCAHGGWRQAVLGHAIATSASGAMNLCRGADGPDAGCMRSHTALLGHASAASASGAMSLCRCADGSDARFHRPEADCCWNYTILSGRAIITMATGIVRCRSKWALANAGHSTENSAAPYRPEAGRWWWPKASHG